MSYLAEFMSSCGMTYLNIGYDQVKDNLRLLGACEFDESVDWSRYMRDFTVEDVLIDDHRCLGNRDLQRMIKEEGLTNYLNQIKKFLKRGGHKGIECFYNAKMNISFIYCKHTNIFGARNQDHSIRAGGIRRHELIEDELDVIVDGLNLARAMTYKNCWSQVPYGGSKIVVQSKPVNLNDMEELGFYAWSLDRTRSYTGPDMGFSPEFADALREHFTRNIIGGRGSPIGPTGGPAAFGEYSAIKTAYKHLYGKDKLSGVTIAIQGLGAVGLPLSNYLLEDEADLIVTDIDRSKVDKVMDLADRIGKGNVEYVQPEDIYRVEAGVFSPCAMGGIITEGRIREFKFKIIIGSANNQLDAVSREGEVRLARILAGRGVLFLVDWTHNVGGIIAGWAEYKYREKSSFNLIKPKIKSICTEKILTLLKESEKSGKTPTEVAYETVECMVQQEPMQFDPWIWSL